MKIISNKQEKGYNLLTNFHAFDVGDTGRDDMNVGSTQRCQFCGSSGVADDRKDGVVLVCTKGANKCELYRNRSASISF